MKYRKKTVVIDALQWTGKNYEEIYRFTDGRIFSAYYRNKNVQIAVPTVRGTVVAHEGDYIIRGIHGELMLCPKDLFDKTYEKID